MTKVNKDFPHLCPSCHSKMKVQKLQCTNCDTYVEGLFELSSLAQLHREEQEFVLNFIKMSGSLKKMAKIMNRSYPSVRNKLDEVIEKIEKIEKENSE